LIDEPVSPLRQCMIENMTVRHFKEKVQKDYIRHVTIYKNFLGRSPDPATSSFHPVHAAPPSPPPASPRGDGGVEIRYDHRRMNRPAWDNLRPALVNLTSPCRRRSNMPSAHLWTTLI
jgi:hypothetical protein